MEKLCRQRLGRLERCESRYGEGAEIRARTQAKVGRGSAEEGLQNLDLQHQATSHYQRAISVSPTMLSRTIAALKAEKTPIDYVIAPYEADAQLGWFAKEGRKK